MKANTFTSEAIVLWRKKRKYCSIYAFLTKLEGIILCSVPHKRKANYKEGAYLQPLSRLYLTVVPNGDMYDIIQIDGISTRDYESLEDISYATFSGELVSALFEKGKLDRSVYTLNTIALHFRHCKSISIYCDHITNGWCSLQDTKDNATYCVFIYITEGNI